MAGHTTRFHHITRAEKYNTTGLSPSSTHNAFTFQPMKFP